jgi:HD-GYP domain-containing protein (c-di-GMP phosphodiesterase class II)/PAS domain-containing protein/putative methionine-R-sulfoxide reductase with GAF domain
VALGITLLAFLLRFALVQGLGLVMPTFITFYPAVIVAAVLGGLWPGLFATVLCALGALFFVIPPLYTFRIATLSDAVALAFFALMGVLISLLAEHYRQGRETIADLREKEAVWIVNAKFELALDRMSDAVFITDEQGRFLHINAAFAAFFRFPSTTECPRDRKGYLELLDISRLTGEPIPPKDWAVSRALRGETGNDVVLRLRRKDTGVSWIGSYNYAPLRNPGGAIIGSVVVARDITEAHRAKIDIERLLRVSTVLSDINQTIVRVKDSVSMFNTACRIAVEKGHFLMAWIGMVDPDSGILAPIASAGRANDYLDHISIDLRDPAAGAGPAARAFHTGRHVVCNNIEHEPSRPWKSFALEIGYRSVASFPLVVDGRPMGVFSLYSGDVDFFDEKEIHLIDEMAMDLSFALEVNLHEQKRLILETSTSAHLRELKVLSEINMALLVATSEKDLLQAYCRIAVESAGYRMAWVGFAEQTPEKVIVPVAWAGHEDGYLSAIRPMWDGGEFSQGPAGRAIRSGQIEYNRDSNAPGAAPFQAEAEKRGYKAVIAIPFETDPGSMACLTMYASTSLDWSQAEQHLMQQMAHALGYGIRTLRGTIARAQYLEQIRDSLEHTIDLIAGTVDRRDPYTAGHQRRVAELSVRIARKLAVEEEQIRGLRLAATIHDLGKIGIPAELLSKPAALSRAEFALVKEHVQIGHDIVKNVTFPWPIADMILQHHERMDGSGYPQGLRGDAMLLESRILAVADVVEAMASHRPYRPSRGIDAALEELLKDRGTLYASAVVDACVSVFREDGFQFTT